MPSNLSVRKLLAGEKVDFECVDSDLTEFFRVDSLSYLLQHLAVTYVIELSGEAIAMFSLCNDRLDIHDFDDNRKLLKKAADGIPHVKRGLRSFPAVKIARLAVKKGLERKHGIGTAIVVFIQAFFLHKNKTGCRFLTVDSYPGSVGFYLKSGFKKVDKATEEDLETCPHCKNALPLASEESHLNDHVLMFQDFVLLADSEKMKEMAPIVDRLLQEDKAEFTQLAASVQKEPHFE